MENNTGVHSVRKNALYGMLRGFATAVFPIVVFAYVSRILNPEGIGKINFSNTFVQYFILLGGLGINSYGIREGAKCRADKKALSQLAAELFLLNAVMTVLALVLFGIALAVSEPLSPYRKVLLIYSLAIPLSTLSMEWLYCAVEEYAYIARRILLFRIGGFFCILLFVKKPQDILVYGFLQVAANYGNSVVNFFHARRYLSFSHLDRLKMKRHFVPVAALFVISVSLTLYSSIDITMLGLLVNEWEVGIYSAGTKAVHMLLYMSSCGIAVVMPRVSYLMAEGEQGTIQKYRKLLCHYLYMGLVPCIAGLMIWGKMLIRLLAGSDFLGAYPVIVILSCDLLLSSIRALFDHTVFVPCRKERFMTGVMAAAVTVNVILNAGMIPVWGAKGAAFASVCSEALIVAAYAVYGKRHCRELRVFRWGFPYLAGGGMLLLIWQGSRLFFTEFTAAAVATLAGGTGYVLLLLWSGDSYFRELLVWIQSFYRRHLGR